ncbi:2Fe-2S iron-sulfur cluster-binding protein [Microbispora sp. KK1-11]|uniref:2Fe-2S iron-sulfur cluster-binding protein n=1 Tax=Microbispora sp. KK1-11 TaxID=2053005 RepID=UPI00115903B0|nr:2Fe-2S iron-sulfur cluster-binding protein [Microbispora sp. KK1-11]TQS20817.1 2Fe-2S iron-sulfur cluster binding domain-containing protein [Microbispora sp. KK1-11]
MTNIEPPRSEAVTTIEHAGVLPDLTCMPAYLVPGHRRGQRLSTQISCSYCGVGDGAILADTTVRPFVLTGAQPTHGCVKLGQSRMEQASAHPIHTTPSVLDRTTGRRRPITYGEAISWLAFHVLGHRGPGARTLVYACGQVDYFTVFAMQEVFRLLGVRNVTGNAEHCLNAGAVHNEVLTGQEGPFITIDQAFNGPNRVFLLNGWNGMISHPPAYRLLARRTDLDAYLVEVMVTETAKDLARRLSDDRVLLVRPRSDPHLALAVAHEILTRHARAVEERFVTRFSDAGTFAAFRELALSEPYAPENVVVRIAAEERYRLPLLRAIRELAAKLADPATVPIAIPSVGLSQSSGIVAHCLWGNLLAMLGKYGLRGEGDPAGGVLRLPGQINAESEVQGLSRKFFMGRIPIEQADEAARRMGLPPGSYKRVLEDTPRAALDYSEPTPGERELFLCVGTQFEANMPNRRRWTDKLTDSSSTLVVIDPIPDPWSLAHADLIIPSPPHPATTKLYQNGEWRLRLSVPQKKAPAETRSDATIIYDLMAEITGLLEADAGLAARHADLAGHLRSGYLRRRFCQPPGKGGRGLRRVDGEVSRVQLWNRVQDYLHGGSGPLYCAFDHADGTPIRWGELLRSHSVVYGGVGVNRYLLDYADPDASPFRDIYRAPRLFTFFVPTEADLFLPEGIVLNSGRSSLSDDRRRIRFATSTFNSGKATPVADMPDEHPLHVSPSLAERIGLEDGGLAKVTSTRHGASVELPVTVSDRVKGDTVYVSFHRSRAQEGRGLYINDVTDHEGRCAYSSQVQLKIQPVTLEPAVARRRRPLMAAHHEAPVWEGIDTPLVVSRLLWETADTCTVRLQSDPPRRFVYLPGQYCTLVLDVGGRRVTRSYSISSSPSRPYALDLTVKRVPGGLVSNWLLDNLRTGDRLRAKAPRGGFRLDPDDLPDKVLFIGAGSGVTPLMSMSRWLCDVSAPVDAVFLQSARHADEAVFDRELRLLAERHRRHFSYRLVTTRTSGGGRLDRALLDAEVPDLRDRVAYLCGPASFMDAVTQLLTGLGLNPSKVRRESFGTVAEAPEPGAGTCRVDFVRSGRSVTAVQGRPLLDAAESAEIDLEYGCRSGTCGDCRVRVVSGRLASPPSDALTGDEIAQGYTLACVSRVEEDCVVDI